MKKIIMMTVIGLMLVNAAKTFADVRRWFFRNFTETPGVIHFDKTNKPSITIKPGELLRVLTDKGITSGSVEIGGGKPKDFNNYVKQIWNYSEKYNEIMIHILPDNSLKVYKGGWEKWRNYYEGKLYEGPGYTALFDKNTIDYSK